MPDNRESYLKYFISRNIDQLIHLQNPMEKALFFPTRVHIEPTNACNLRCIHCHHNDLGVSRKYTKPLGFMEFELLKKVIDEISELNCEVSLDNQGEPLLNRQIIKMISYCKEKNIFTSLLTNATMLDESISRQIIEAGLDRIVFSFDSVIRKEYESIRRRAKFLPTLFNILTFIRLNYEWGGRVFVALSIIPQSSNRQNMEQFRSFFESLPINTIFFSNLLNLSGFSGIGGQIDLNNGKKRQGKNKQICRVPWENIVINWDGEVTICPIDVNNIYTVGNVSRQSLVSIWNNKKYRTFRKAHINHSFNEIEVSGSLCSECNCIFDPEYDLNNYKEFVKRDLFRKAAQIFSPQNTAIDIGVKTKYEHLLEVMKKYPDNLMEYLRYE